jgi:hypothetical protein
MDGAPIAELMTPDFRAGHPPEVVPAAIRGREEVAGSWDAAAEADVTERLRQLGYLG